MEPGRGGKESIKREPSQFMFAVDRSVRTPERLNNRPGELGRAGSHQSPQTPRKLNGPPGSHLIDTYRRSYFLNTYLSRIPYAKYTGSHEYRCLCELALAFLQQHGWAASDGGLTYLGGICAYANRPRQAGQLVPHKRGAVAATATLLCNTNWWRSLVSSSPHPPELVSIPVPRTSDPTSRMFGRGR